MRVILSRKGFDSSYGGIPSPILPDGSLISLPIPYESGCKKYSELRHSEWGTYQDVIQSLRNKNTIYAKGKWVPITEESRCHLDPDLQRNVTDRQHDDEWKPMFGQSNGAQAHLASNDVGEDSLFLFFGWFRQTTERDGRLRFERNAPDLHLIFGYLQVERVIRDPTNLQPWMEDHDHYSLIENGVPQEVLYVSRPNLSFATSSGGAELLKYDKNRVLTKNTMSRSRWSLPDFS